MTTGRANPTSDIDAWVFVDPRAIELQEVETSAVEKHRNFPEHFTEDDKKIAVFMQVAIQSEVQKRFNLQHDQVAHIRVIPLNPERVSELMDMYLDSLEEYHRLQAEKTARLQAWEAQLDRCFEGTIPEEPPLPECPEPSDAIRYDIVSTVSNLFHLGFGDISALREVVISRLENIPDDFPENKEKIWASILGSTATMESTEKVREIPLSRARTYFRIGNRTH